MPNVLLTYRPMDEHTCRMVKSGPDEDIKTQKARARQDFRCRMDLAFEAK